MLRVYLLSWLLRSLKHFLESCEIQWHIIKGLSCLLHSRELPSFEPTMVVSVVFFVSVVSTVSVVSVFFDLLAFFHFFRAAYLATWLARHLAVWLAHHLASCLLGWLPGYLCSCLAISLPGWLAAHKDSEHKVDSEHPE